MMCSRVEYKLLEPLEFIATGQSSIGIEYESVLGYNDCLNSYIVVQELEKVAAFI